MLKLFYKTFLVSVLSGSLLLMDFSYKGFLLSAAQAESVKTEKINDKDLMGTLTMTAVGVLAKRLYTYKPTTDIMLAAAGGAIFLGGEVLAFVKLKDVMKGMEEQITRDKNGNVNKEQIESIERLKKSYEEAKKTANTKKMLQMAAAAAFAAAGATAYMMAAQDAANLATCTTGVTTALTTASSALSSCTGPQAVYCTPAINACIATLKTYSGKIAAYELTRQAVGPSASTLPAAETSCKTSQATQVTVETACSTWPATAGIPAALEGACTQKYLTDALNMSGGSGLLSINNLKNIKPHFNDLFNDLDQQKIASIFSVLNYAEKVIDFVFPAARAELFSAMGIASSLAISYILATSATLGPSIDMFMLIPQKRAIVWGILAGLTFAATTSTNNVIAQIESNIKKIDEILKSMYSMAAGTTATQTQTVGTSSQTTIKPAINTAAAAVKYDDVNLSNAVNGTLPCATGPETGTCKSMEDAGKELPGYENLNADSQLQLSNILKTANGLSGVSKISAGTLNSASKLAAQANAMNASLKRAKATAAEKLKNAGSKVNLDADTKTLSDLIEKAVNDGLKKNNTNAKDMVASLYSGSAGSLGSANPNDDAAKKAAAAAEAEALAAALARAKGSNAGGAIDINAGSAEKMDLGLTGVDNGSNGKMSAEELAAYNQAAKAAAGSMDEYDIKNDISKDSGANIFELISNRYQQSGYPRLFKVKEAATPASTPAVKN